MLNQDTVHWEDSALVDEGDAFGALERHVGATSYRLQQLPAVPTKDHHSPYKEGIVCLQIPQTEHPGLGAIGTDFVRWEDLLNFLALLRSHAGDVCDDEVFLTL